MWIGLGALGTGAAVWGIDLEFGGQVAVFAVLSVASVVIGLRLRKPSGRLNTQTAGLAGRAATALVFDGREGRVRLGDSDWPARVPHGVAAPATGTRLRVEGVDGSVLIVRPESV
jgi:membrane protein implicated in regulation of membrane protease activity